MCDLPLGYCIEKRDSRRSSWSFLQRTTNTQLIIPGLSPNIDYLFRVSAENKYGTGDALESKELFKLKTEQELSKINKKTGLQFFIKFILFFLHNFFIKKFKKPKF